MTVATMRVGVLILYCVCAVWAAQRTDPLVSTKRGLIRGLQASDGDYSMFLGIPFAKVNESNPFGPSLPYPDFEETFEAYDDTAICPQVEEFDNQIVGTLDCLHLNVYVPNKATTRNPLPILVWIYGGGFQIGFAGRFVYGPKYLVRHDVIIVTLNYRVGPYGFMCLDTPEVPGNQGLKDQLSALRWIKENIEAFGGDVSKITIFGESAGAASVDFHLLSEQENLFDKVIMQSGTAQGPWTVEDSNRNTPIELASNLGYETEDFEDALRFLTTVDPKLIIAAATRSASFMPCVEKDFEGVEKFVSKHPINSEIPKVKSIPVLTGYNNDEMFLFGSGPDDVYSFDVFKTNLELAFDLSNDENLATLVRQFYVGDTDEGVDLKWDLIDFASDFTFNHPTHRNIQKYLENGGKVYHYIFSYTGGRNFVKSRRNVTEGGAVHADEIGYLFDVALFTETPSEEDQLIIDRITTLWTNFVKYGDPTPETTELLPVRWSPVTDKVMNYLEIDSELALNRRPFYRRMAFWDLFYKTNKHLLKYYDGSDV